MDKNLELSDASLIKRGQGLVYQGTVTTYTDTTHFACKNLAGLGNDFFASASYADWEIYALWDKGGAGAAPQGLLARCTDYVSSTGTFTHSAFASGNLAVGDKVLLVHPILAWLGTKADAAAAGAVTTTDFLSAYVKQLLNELLGTDGGWTNIDNAAVASLDVALQALAKVLAIDAANQFSASIDGTARTTLEAVATGLNSLMGTRAQDAAAGAVTTTDTLMGYVKQLVTKLIAVQGGTETLESLDDELDAMIDMAKTPDTRTISVINTEETITAFTTTNTNPMYIAGVWLGMENMAAGDVVRWRVFADWDDASIADQITDDNVWTFGGVQTPKWQYMPLGIWVTYEIRVKVTQTDGTARELYSVLDIGQRGS